MTDKKSKKSPPSCPHCGATTFLEYQTVWCTQKVDYNPNEGRYEWGVTSEYFWDTIDAQELRCANCKSEVPLDFLNDWI